MNNSRIMIMIAIVTPLALSGVWIGLYIVRRTGLRSSRTLPLPRRLLAAAISTLAIIVGLWIGSRGQVQDPIMIYFGGLMWLIAMFLIFRRAKTA